MPEATGGSADHRRSVPTRTEIWTRLATLIGIVEKDGLKSLAASQVDELGRLYRATCGHLDLHRTFGVSERRREELNRLVARGHAVIYGRSPNAGRGGVRWLLHAMLLPVTVRRTWAYHAVAAALLLIGGIYGYYGAATDPDWALNFMMGDDNRTPYATRDELLLTLRRGRDGSVGVDEHAAFASMLWVNNTRVALLAFFIGFLAGVPAALLVLFNGVMLGTYTYTFHSHDLAYEWWAWILPHGVTELGAIVLLAGGGLWIGHRFVAPGGLSRRERFRSMRGDIARLLALAFPMLLLAALFESFVRQSSLPDGGRYVFAVISLIVWVAFLGFVRPSREIVEEELAPATEARRRVALPDVEELCAPVRRA